MTDPAFTLTPRSSPTLTPSLTPTLTLVVAAACPKGQYRTGCGGLQFHVDSSNTRTHRVQSHGEPVLPLAWALWLEVALFRSNTTRRSPTSPVCFNPGATPGAVARSVRWATTRTCTPTRARAAAQFKTTKPCEREPSHRRACGSCLQRQNPHVCAAHPIGARCAAIVVMGSGARPAAG